MECLYGVVRAQHPGELREIATETCRKMLLQHENMNL